MPGVRTSFTQLDFALVFGTGRDEWISLDLRTGKLNWRFPAPSSGDHCYENSTPDTDGVSVVVVAHNLMLYGLDGTGRKVWQKLARAAVSTNPFVYKDVEYFGSANRHVYGVNPATGEQLADLPVQAAPVRGFIWGGENDAEEIFFFGLIEKGGQERHLLLAYSDEFEREFWSSGSNTTWTSGVPMAWRDEVIAGNCQGAITAYRALDGALRWDGHVAGCVKGITHDDSELYIAVRKGVVYAYKP